MCYDTSVSTPLPVIPNTFRVSLKWSVSGQTAVNVIHIRSTTAAGNATLVYNCLNAHVTGGMWGTAAGVGGIQEVDIIPLDGVTGTSTFITGGPAKWLGGGGSDFTPAASALIKLQTGLRGRDNRGRIYLPFLDEAQQTEGKLVGTTAADRTANWETFLAAIIADGTTPCYLTVAAYDRAHGGAGAHESIVTTLAMEQAIATQRRRQGRLR